MPRFVIHHTGESSQVFELLGGRPVSIGRAKSSNLMLDNPSVSKVHAVVTSTPDGKWQIIDRGSSNGVKINGVPVKDAVLRADDEITIGEYRLRFEDSASRKVVTYGTMELPQRFAKVLKESAYSGSLMPVEPLGAVAPPDVGRRTDVQERMRGLERENRLLTLLYRVNRTLSEQPTVAEATQRTLDLVLEIEGAERAYSMLLDSESMERGNFSSDNYGFQPAVIRYRGKSGGLPAPGAPQLTISRSIIRQVMQAGGMPLLVSDAKADPRLAASKSVVLAGIQSAMCAPLGIGEKLRGLLYVDNLSRRGMFTVDDLNVFAVIAVQAGLAIDRVRTRTEVAEHSFQ
jgi:hypothetical protein